jgi:4-amino-4-deoxy-L-arabinose transferase-like glycosyltransferase
MTSQAEDVQAAQAPRPWFGLVLIFLAAFGLRWAIVQQYEADHPLATAPVIDELSYVEWGGRIAGGDWIGDEVFFQEPLYPYFIGVTFSVLGEDLHGLRVLQCLLGALTVLLVWSITNELFERKAAWLAAVAMSLYPPAMLLPCLFLKPNLFLPIFGLFLLGLLRVRLKDNRWIALGVLGGLGALLRGNMLILLPCFFLWPFARAWSESRAAQRGVRAAGLFGLGVMLVLLPVFLRNWAVGGQFALTTSGAGTNVYGGNNAENPYGVATEFPWVRGIPRYEAGDWRREAERRLDRELNGSESSSYWLGQVVESMGEDPGLHVSILWNKLRLALNHYEVPDNHHLGWDARYVPLLRLPWPGFGLLGGVALAGLFLAIASRSRTSAQTQLAIAFLLYLGTIVVTVMSMRARLPLVVALFPFFGYGTVRGLGALKGSASRPGTAVAVLIGLSIALIPVFRATEVERDLAERDYNLAVSWLARGDHLQEVSDLAQGLAARYPNTSRFQTLLADTEWRRGARDRDEGREGPGQALIQEALARLKPITQDAQVSPRERSRAFRLAAYIQSDLRRWSVAERFFRSAREFAPEDPELLFAHGQALLALGEGPQVQEAHELFEKLIKLAPESPEAQAAARLLPE